MKGFFIIFTGLLLAWNANAEPLRLHFPDKPNTSSIEEQILDSNPDQFTLASDSNSADINIVSGFNCSSGTITRPTLNIALYRFLQTGEDSSSCFGLYEEPAPEDQLWLLQRLLPKTLRVGVLLHRDNAWIQSRLRKTNNNKLEIRYLWVNSESDIPPALSKLLPQVDALLLFPDNRLFNAKTAKHLLLSTYRQRRPVIGPNESFVAAGSLASIYLSDEDKVSGSVKLLNSYKEEQITHSIFSAKSIEINRYVARLFSVDDTSPEELESLLENRHETRH